ncbi:MAG: alcohol dehydrogenase catalytic domain-containing protein [Chloroflexi bacterium]|nr:alcohol dehydrogenase catalytic domain-containing protein [Chloroflexota bacterium]
MRATIFEEPGKVSVQDRPTPDAGPGEVRLRVAASSLCASDVRVYRGEKYARAGVIPGHEIAGVVDEVGEGVAGVAEGDRVIICPIVSCGHCRFCQTGKRNRCTSRQTLGYDIDGGFAESVLVPAAIVGLGQVFTVPDDLPLDVAALTEPAACVTASLELCRTGIGDSLFIIGAGPMGLMHVLMARAAGAAPIIVSEPVAERRETARRWGADVVLDPEADDVTAAVKDATSGAGADGVVLSVGVPQLVEPALAAVRPQGVVNLFAGFPPGNPVPFDPNFVHYGEVVLTGSQNATSDQYRRTVAMLGHVPHIDEVVTNRYHIEDAPRAYASRLELDGLKSLVEFPGVDRH